MASLRKPGAAGYAFLALVCGVLSYWKFNIIDPVQTPQLFYKTIDLYSEHYPMAFYGFKQLASGSLPLWDPYQLFGMPFMAIPHTGLFYLGNLPYLFFHTASAIEIVYLTHTLFAGWTIWLLTALRSPSKMAIPANYRDSTRDRSAMADLPVTTCRAPESTRPSPSNKQ